MHAGPRGQRFILLALATVYTLQVHSRWWFGGRPSPVSKTASHGQREAVGRLPLLRVHLWNPPGCLIGWEQSVPRGEGIRGRKAVGFFFLFSFFFVLV